METVGYFTISLTFPEGIPGKVIYQQNSNELFLSANGKLVGLAGMAHLESRQLAEEFLSAYLPRLQKRYGADVRVEVGEWTASARNKRLMARIEKDSLLAQKRLDTGILASNMTP